MIGRLLRDPTDLVEIVAPFGARAGDVEHQPHTGNPAPALGTIVRRAEHVVGNQHGRCRDAVHLRELSRELRGQPVAAVVSEQIQHAAPAVHPLGRRQHRLHGGGGEHVPDGNPGTQARPDISEEHRKVAGSASRHDAHASAGGVGADEGAACIIDGPEMARVGVEHRLDDLVDEAIGGVDDLSHGSVPPAAAGAYPYPDRMGYVVDN